MLFQVILDFCNLKFLSMSIYLQKPLAVVNAQHVVELVTLTNLLGFSQGSQICTLYKVPGNKIFIVF